MSVFNHLVKGGADISSVFQLIEATIFDNYTEVILPIYLAYLQYEVIILAVAQNSVHQ
jgi:hypothetical protein